MESPQFEALVQRMARFAQSSPRAYRWWVYTLATLGFACLLLLILLLLGILAVLVVLVVREHHAVTLAIKLILVVGALLFVVLRALWVKLEPPEGEVLDRDEAPQLFALLDRLRQRLDTPAVHHVLVTRDFNAGVTQVPRLGVFGWHRNYLLLGLPLLRSLSVPQFEAVLAHELGHLSRGHARIGNWIYRLRLTWRRLDQSLAEKPHWGSGALRSFLHWYVPYFNASSYPLARSNEFEADATSVQLTSRQAAAEALTNVNVMNSYLSERYWPAVHSAAREMAQPAFGPYSLFRAPSSEEITVRDAQRWLEHALAQPTTHDDTHPCLSERLRALGVEARIALPAAGAAADGLLGAASARLALGYDAHWRARVEESWKAAYENTQKSRARLAELRAQLAAAPLGTSEGIELAALEEDVGDGAARALALRRELVARDPTAPLARYVLARQLLQQGDESGVPIMEEVISAEPEAAESGSQLLRDYWWQRGQPDKARAWHERLAGYKQASEEAKRERNELALGDAWLDHGLDEATLASLVASLKQIQGLARAYLVRKRVVHQPERPLYVLGFTAAGLPLTRDGRSKEVMEQLRTAVQFPGETLIINLDGANQQFVQKFWAVATATVI